MKRNKLWLITVFLLLVYIAPVQAQQKKQPAKKGQTTKKGQQPAKKTTPTTTPKKQDTKTAPPPDVTTAPVDATGHEAKVRDMVAFLEYVLNTLGSSATLARDKDVLVTQSYNKIFRDGKVQIEDDLDADRKVITNKDVQAYLKDVDFFFDDVKFEFTIDEIQQKTLAGDKLFYKVTLRRNMKGTTVAGKAVNSTLKRFVEINYNPQDQDLKIVSIYTNEFNEKGALLEWWNQLSYEWQEIFTRKLGLADSVTMGDIKNITAIESLDLSRNSYIQNLEPLAALVGLRTLDISNTFIADISPIRNLTELVNLNLAHTGVADLTPLKYAEGMQRLDIGYTKVRDLAPLERMTRLEFLEMENLEANDFTVLGKLTFLKQLDVSGATLEHSTALEPLVNLQELNLSQTALTDLAGLKGMKKLMILRLDSTRHADLTPLSSLEGLKTLYVNYTPVATLAPLDVLTHLEKIYCDHTAINRAAADTFIAANPGVLVIFDSEDLKGWWDTLPAVWQKIFRDAAHTAAEPGKEELARITTLDSINLGGNAQIRSLDPLEKLTKLKVVIAAKTSIRDLMPLQDLQEIRTLDIRDTPVDDLAVAGRFKKLAILHADGSKIQTLEPLASAGSLRKVYADKTAITDEQAGQLLRQHPECLVVYKTDSLQAWWNGVTDDWKEIFNTQLRMQAQPTREDLHRLIELKTVHAGETRIGDLTPLQVFIRLSELHFAGTAVTDVTPLTKVKTLTSLHLTHSPLRKLDPLAQLTNLEDLDISNTPTEDLKPLGNLQNLKKVNCAGTQIKTLTALETLRSLEFLDCSNTEVKKIDPLQELPMKTLKCYNTKISAKQVESFQKTHPDCQVMYYR